MSYYSTYDSAVPRAPHRAPRIGLSPDVLRHRVTLKGSQRTRHEVEQAMIKRGICRTIHWTLQKEDVRRLTPDVITVRQAMDRLSTEECVAIIVRALEA